ncbi:8710_t:CDS:2 [Diversispora eburnea]|uniref:8710_t:CDS:1 n=1 Tax=Diversispora eburnea TaxID=1213867 RepID=A0A9N9F7K3_9GLOM|nr:8710_t:CDS:2 [Diversispora eburnea]
MSIKLECSEISMVTRETRQTSQINMIFMYIDTSLESLTPEQKEDVVKVSLSTYKLDNVNVREAIHERYDAEIIGKDLFIKYNGGHRSKTHFNLAHSAMMQDPSWDVNIDMICVMGGNNFRPDVGIWFRTLTFAQNSRPIANSCPPPNVWIEVFYNRDPDRSLALSKIDLIRQYLADIEYVGIAIPSATNPFPENPNPWVVTTPATPTLEMPTRAPYIIYLRNVNSNLVYYKMNWNEHLDLKCHWIVEFNVVLNVISQP